MTKFDHIAVLEKQISELSDALAHLGKGTSLRDLIKIIHQPGYTTPAEFKFTQAMVSGISNHVTAINGLTRDLVDAAQTVVLRQ